MDNKKKRVSVKLFRRIIQALSFLLLPGLFTSIFYAIKEVYASLLSGTFSFATMAPQIMLFSGSIIITILIGRFFCGFLCSFGAMGDLLWFLSKKVIKPKWRINEQLDAWLKRLKYLILLFTILGIWTWNIGNISSMTGPWTVFGMYSKIGSWSSVKYLFTAGGLLLLLFIVASLFVERFFCRYLCPLGAVFAIISRVRLFRIIKNTGKCGSLRSCTNKCSMGIPLYHYDKVTSGECIHCFECTVNCPRQNAKANGAPVAVSAISTAAMFGLVYAGNVKAEIQNNQNPAAVIQQTETGNYIDGTYTGTGHGFRGETKTSVTVENGNITDIAILSYDDDAEYFNRVKDIITAEIIQNQDTQVDAVSGATFSSNGIMDSVADALSIMNAAEPVESSEEVQNNTVLNAEYEDGTYTGTGTGFRGETEVSVKVIDGKIQDITISSYQDDEEFFVRAEDLVIEEIIQNQDVSVDAVSGATYSSNGIMEAVANALGVSYTNPNSNMKKEWHSDHHRGK